MQDFGLLLLRVLFGSMMLFSHGLSKISKFEQLSTTFPDPLALGSKASLILAIFAEVVCSILLILGLKTRLAAMPLLITMLVAAFIVHAADPWQKQEFGLLYGVTFLALIFTGGGRFSLDQIIYRK